MKVLTSRQCLNLAKLFKGGMTIWELTCKYGIPMWEVERIIRHVLCNQEAK